MPAKSAASDRVDPRAILQTTPGHAMVALRHIKLPRGTNQQSRAYVLPQRELRVIGGVVGLHPEPVLVVEHEGLVGPRDVLVGVKETPAE